MRPGTASVPFSSKDFVMHVPERSAAILSLAIFLAPFAGCGGGGYEGASVSAKALDVDPPVAERGDHVWTYHGDTIPDPYAWLKDKESPKTIAYLEA